MANIKRKTGFLSGREAGLTLLEMVVALGILSTISLAFIGGLTSNTKSVYIADERATAESMARSQMEWVKYSPYSFNATSYSLAPILDATDYEYYSANITAAPLHDPDDGLQKITVTISREDAVIYTLEGYKTDR